MLILPPAFAAEIKLEANGGASLTNAIISQSQYAVTDGETSITVSADITEELVKGFGGKAADDESAYINVHGMPVSSEIENFSKYGTHKQFLMYNKGNYAKTGYIVYEANIFPQDENMGSFDFRTNNNSGISNGISDPTSVGILPGRWNNVKAVFDMNSASPSEAPYTYPKVTLYVNGGSGVDISKGTSGSAISNYNPGRMSFYAEGSDTAKQTDQAIYWDDCKVSVETSAVGTQDMPILNENSKFTLSEVAFVKKLTVNADTYVSDLSSDNGVVRVYSDNSYSRELTSSQRLTTGNIVVVADDTNCLYTYYTVEEKGMLAYMNGASVSGLTEPGTTAYNSKSYPAGIAGKADSDISTQFDTSKLQSTYYSYEYGKCMSKSTAPYLVIEMSVLPDDYAYYFSLRTQASYLISPSIYMTTDTNTNRIRALVPNRWNKMTFVIKNQYALGKASGDYSSTAVTDSVAKAGLHLLDTYVNGELVSENYKMPYWGYTFAYGSGSRRGSLLRLITYPNGTVDSTMALDNIKIYETDSYNAADFTVMPKLDESEKYSIDGETVYIYSEISSRVSDLSVKNASVRVYTDGTLATSVGANDELYAGNVIAVSDIDRVTYYTVEEKSAILSTVHTATTYEEWQNTTVSGSYNAAVNIVEDVIGKPLGDGATKIQLSESGTYADILCWNNYTDDTTVQSYVTEFSIYPKGTAGELIALTLKTTNNTILGNAALTENVWHRAALVYDAETNTAKTYIDGTLCDTVSNITISADEMLRLGFSGTGNDTAYIDDLKAWTSEISDILPTFAAQNITKCNYGIVYGNELLITENKVTPADILHSGDKLYAFRNDTLLADDEILEKGDLIFVINDDIYLNTYTVSDYLTLVYDFANENSGCAKGKISLDFKGTCDDVSAELLWAKGNENDGYTPLADYTAIKTLTGAELENGYEITKDIFIPEEVSALMARITDEDITYDVVAVLPETKVTEKSTPEYTVALASDFHFGGYNAVDSTAPTHEKALEHINSYADVMVVNGDITTWYGAYSKAQIDAYQSGDTSTEEVGTSQWQLAEDYFKRYTIPVYMVEGNHETPEGNYTTALTNGATTSERYDKFLADWIDYSVNNNYYPDGIEREILDDTDDTLATFYDDYVGENGYHFVFLRVPRCGSFILTQQELDFLDKKLFELEESGKPIFVFAHVPYTNTVGRLGNYWINKSFTQAEFKEIIDRHPNVIEVSGHSHISLDTEYAHTINGKQESPSYVHDGGIISLAYPQGDNNTDTVEVTGEAMCVYAEIYEDRIVTRGYDLMNEKWVSQGVNQITRKSPCPISELSVSKTTIGDYSLLSGICTDENLTYQWYVNGTAQEGQNIIISNDFDGYLALRVYDSNGNYRSISYDSLSEIPENGDNKFTADEIILYATATADAEIYIAQYNENKVLIGVTPLKTTDGLNKITAEIKDGADTIKIMTWNEMKPVKNSAEILIK